MSPMLTRAEIEIRDTFLAEAVSRMAEAEAILTDATSKTIASAFMERYWEARTRDFEEWKRAKYGDAE